MDSKDSMASTSTAPQTALLKKQKQKQKLANMQVQVSSFVRCTKRRRVKTSFEECCVVGDKPRGVLDDPDILRLIFCQLSFRDLFLSVSSVCRSWEAVCWDYLFWSRNTLDLSSIGVVGLGTPDISAIALAPPSRLDCLLDFLWLYSTETPLERNAILMRKLKSILDGDGLYKSTDIWRSSIETIILPYHLKIQDAHLLYIAERTPSVERLLLLRFTCSNSVGCFIKALQNWKHLKEIHLGPPEFYALFPQFIEEIGKGCRKLESLHIHDGLVVDSCRAALIAKNLPGLRKIEFDRCMIKPSGVSTLYTMCLQLEEIYVNGCYRVLDNEIPCCFPVYDRFRLLLMVGEDGFAKLEVKPYPLRLYKRPNDADQEGTEWQREVELWISSAASVINTARREYVRSLLFE